MKLSGEIGHWASRNLRVVFACALLCSTARVSAGQAGSKTDAARMRWKPVSEAQMKVDDKTPLTWNIFQVDRKDKKNAKSAADLVLLLVGHRYVLLNLKSRIAYEIPVASLQVRGTDFESGNLTSEGRVIPSSDWAERDVGPAELIHLTLGDYGRVLEVSLPHPPDLRAFY